MASIKNCDSCGSYVDNDIVIPASPTCRLWRTNEAPTAPERASIAKLLADARECLSQIDASLFNIHSKFIGLLEKRSSMQEAIACHGSLLSPIRRLPEEILSYIFFLCIPTWREKASLSTTRAPLLLTQVCVPWRNCAWSSQRLWSSFTISSKVTTHRSLLDHWLSHTISSPLSIFIKDSHKHRASPLWPSISRTIQYCDRWQELIIHMPTSTLSRFGSVKHRLPSLEKFTVKLIHNHIQPIDIFEFAPRLRCVQLKTAVKPSQLRLPWNQLDTLEIRVGGMRHLFSILALSPNLKNITLDSSDLDGTTDHYLGSIITLPHLISLKISMPCDIRHLCKNMRCPELKSLNILTSAVSLMSDEFSGFLASSSSLKQLSIHYQKISQPIDLLPCLAAASTVSVLELDIASPDPWLTSAATGMYPNTAVSLGTVMDLMTDYSGSGERILLPALEELSVTKSPLDARLFVNMIHSRNGNANGGKSVAVLKRVHLSDHLESFDLSKEELSLFFGAIDRGAPELRVPPYFQVVLNACRRDCDLAELPIDLWSMNQDWRGETLAAGP